MFGLAQFVLRCNAPASESEILVSPQACINLVDGHCVAMFANSYPNASHWKYRHYEAWFYGGSNKREHAIRHLIESFALLADSYAAETEGERTLGQDGYFHEHARDMIDAMLALLNFDIGRFDGGTLDRLIRKLAETAGVELEQ
jgi:hypothetical protein